ncbi:hypothetical protein ACHAWF_002494, partial [Thalassiosira exigua]
PWLRPRSSTVSHSCWPDRPFLQPSASTLYFFLSFCHRRWFLLQLVRHFLLHNTLAMDRPDDEDRMSKCAACGKNSNALKQCQACKLVKYCNASCQKEHWSIHKRGCKKRAALHEEALFKQTPLKDDCPVCLQPLPLLPRESSYQSCCGKMLCNGCNYAHARSENKKRVPIEEQRCCLCNEPKFPPHRQREVLIERWTKRAEAGDAIAVYSLGVSYEEGCGVPQDPKKAMDFWHQAAKLGCADAYYAIGEAYSEGRLVEKDMEKAKYYWELGAMRGDISSRVSLGETESIQRNAHRAIKHFLIAAKCGRDDALDYVKQVYHFGGVSKEELETALRAHKTSRDKMQSADRIAAERHEENRLDGWSNDGALFDKPPPPEECPICLLPFPARLEERRYQPCCGKTICLGCAYAGEASSGLGGFPCPFCRASNPSGEERMERVNKRVQSGDADAIHMLGCFYSEGKYGLPRDKRKRLELWLEAEKLGCIDVYYNLAEIYRTGDGGECDMKKAKYYWELGAIKGDVKSRHLLGVHAHNDGDIENALKHYMIAAGCGDDHSLNIIRQGALEGYFSADDYSSALRAHEGPKNEMQSDHRDAALRLLENRKNQGTTR